MEMDLINQKQPRRFFIFITGVFLIFLQINFCDAGPRIPKTPARILAQRAGAAHFEERYEKISSSEEKRHHVRKRASDEDDFDYEVYQGVVGRPGIDFPILPRIPQTSFSCRTYGNGYFADLETECQVFHICDDGRKISFLCPNGTIFQQTELICDWWFKVNCAKSPGYYSESSEILLRAQNRRSKYFGGGTDIFDDSARRPSPKVKTEYEIKSYRKYFENDRPNQKKKDHKKIDSDEKQPSVESFDFEDITESITVPSLTNNKKEKIISRIDSNDAEMQVVAESASFVGNNQRRNGYIYNNPSNEDKKSDKKNDITSSKTLEKTKNIDRGRQRYTGDSNNKFSYDQGKNDTVKNLNTQQEISKNVTQTTSSRNRQNTYTTARRLDTTRTTPYYTPTVPTVSLNKITQANIVLNTNDKRKQLNKQSSNQNISTVIENGKFLESTKSKNYNTTVQTNIESNLSTSTPQQHRTTLSNTSQFGKKISNGSTATTQQRQGYDYSFGRSTQSSFNTQSRSSIHQEGITVPTITLPPRTQNEKVVSSYNSKNSFANTDTTAKKSSDGIRSNTPKPLIVELRSSLLSNSSVNKSANIASFNILSSGAFSKSSPYQNLNSLSNKNYLTTTTSRFPSGGYTNFPNKVTTAKPTYTSKESTTPRSSSAGPTYLPKPTQPSLGSRSDVTEHVKEMVQTLNQLKKDLNVNTETLNKDANKYLGKTRPGLEIPPSSGPETLHSLALYFAGEEQSAAMSDKSSKSLITKAANISNGLLTNKTVKGYEKLFGLETTELPTETTISPNYREDLSSDNNDLEGQHTNGPLGDSISKPETRKIAQVFTNALSAYLEDPDTFRRTLAKVRPTNPTPTESNLINGRLRTTTNKYFNRGTGASYLPTIATTASPTGTTTELYDLDFSDGNRGTSRKNIENVNTFTTVIPTTEKSRTSLKNADKTPASRLLTERRGKARITLNTDEFVTTEPNEIAMEVNKGLSISTTASSYETNKKPKRIEFASKTSVKSSAIPIATPNPRINFDLLPPVKKNDSSYSKILPPLFDDDEESLQRAQSQSFATAKNSLNKKGFDNKSNQNRNRIEITTSRPGYYITKTTPTTDFPDTRKYSPNPWSSLAYTVFLDPLTINDGLMEEMKTTTSSPYTYLPKAKTTTTESNPVHVNLNSMLIASNRDKSKEILTNRLGKAYPGIPENLLPPKDGMQRIANKMFGTLNETSADHLMNVMKKAEDNHTVRRLILLLIQTCDEDYSKTVEQSRQALLNALIGMDEKLAIEDEIEVIKLKPKRRGKSISPSNEGLNDLTQTTTEVPVTTYRRSSSDLKSISTTQSPSYWTTSTLDPPVQTSTIHNSMEETTRFEIRVEDSDDISSTTRNYESNEKTTTTTDPSTITTTTSQETLFNTTPIIPISSQIGLKRKAKDLEGFISQATNSNSDSNTLSNSSHKSSDERALELLKSLYSLASKFGRR